MRKSFYVRMHEGTLEILAWKLEVATRYAAVTDIFKIEEIEAKIVETKALLAAAQAAGV